MKVRPNSSIVSDLTICTRCIYDERVSGIHFDENGVCNYCHQIESLKTEYGTGTEKGMACLDSIVEEIREAGKDRPYDSIVGVSGGTDSSYLLYKLKEWGLRPLAVHFDNTWNTAIATQNIQKVLSALNIDLYTYVVDNKEMDDIFRSFMLAGVSEFDAATDLALAEVLYRAANKYNIKYIFEGHSFLTEGITPIASNYFDGKYIKSIHNRYGTVPMKTYPLMTLVRFLWWATVSRIKKIRPFWYINYSKEDAQKLLKQKFGWIYYNGHHLENRSSSFANAVYWPQKSNVDFRNNALSALVRNNKINRKDAWKEYISPPSVELDLVDYVKKRLSLSTREYDEIMDTPPKSWHEYPTYKKQFEMLRPLFAILAKANLVPMSFYLKYCFPMKER